MKGTVGIVIRKTLLILGLITGALLAIAGLVGLANSSDSEKLFSLILFIPSGILLFVCIRGLMIIKSSNKNSGSFSDDVTMPFEKTEAGKVASVDIVNDYGFKKVSTTNSLSDANNHIDHDREQAQTVLDNANELNETDVQEVHPQDLERVDRQTDIVEACSGKTFSFDPIEQSNEFACSGEEKKDSVKNNVAEIERKISESIDTSYIRPTNEKVLIGNIIGCEVDRSDDGFFVKSLENYVIPKADENTQIEFINNILKYASPKTVKLVLFDEGFTYNAYKKVPHIYEYVTNLVDTVPAFRMLRYAMNNRKTIFANHNCKDIDSYNEFICMDQKDNETHFFGNQSSTDARILCHYVVIINEYYRIKGLPAVDDVMIPLLMQGKQYGIHFVLFSKLAINSLSLGVKADLLRIGDDEDLQQIFVKNSTLDKDLSLETIDKEMDGFEFERFCGDLLTGNGFSKITVTQASSDYGADVIAYKDGVKYAIQCKKYSSPVGISAVQEVIASKSMYDCHVAVVLTNNCFTSSATNLAEKNGVLLWGREKLKAMMKNSL